MQHSGQKRGQVGVRDAGAEAGLRGSEISEVVGEQCEQVLLAVGAAVGEGALEGGPHAFVGVQFRGVGRERFQVKTRKAGTEVGQGAALVNLGVVQQNEELSPQVPQEFTHEDADLRAMDIDRVEMAVQPHVPTPRADREAGDSGDSVMAIDVVVQGRLAARAPGLAHLRNQQEPGFVDENDMGCQPCGVFFTRGQTVRFHSAMSASLRSAARRSGFWWLQPN